MPVIRELTPAPGIRAGIWLISETLTELMPVAPPGSPGREKADAIRNESRKRQHLAGRALLRQMIFPLYEQISVDPFGKPFLGSGSRMISLSHTAEYAAAAVSETLPVGIDIERIQDRLERVKERFLQESETGMLPAGNLHERLALLWTAKEAVYKLYGKPDIDLRNNIHVGTIDYLCGNVISGKASLDAPGGRRDIVLYFCRIVDHVLAVAWPA